MVNLNSNLFPENSPIEKRHAQKFPEYLNTNLEYQTRQINVSKVTIKELVKVSSVATGTADFATSQALSITTTLTFNIPHSTTKIFGHPYVAIYENDGTVSTDQIYPIRGGSVTLGRYDVQGEFDFVGWDEISSRWRALLIDTQGTSSQVITIATKWAYLDQNVASAS